METTVPHNPSHPTHPSHIHHVLARSYTVYFLFFLAGVSLDLLFDIEFFRGVWPALFGIVLLGLGTILILWAQATSRHLHKKEISKEAFLRGPYRHTRSPTHWGLFLLMVGFGILVNALFLVISSVLAFIITRLTYLKRQEAALIRKYGEPYIEYQKQVLL